MKYFVAQGEDRNFGISTRSTLRGSYIELFDGVTHYELLGPEAGEIVVLVGGLTVPLFYWDQVVAVLHDAGLRTLTYSSYGRGYSDRIRGTYDDALFIRQINDLIQSLNITEPLHVVGASMGALIAMEYVSQNAVSVSSLTIAGPAGLAKKPLALRLLQSSDSLAGFVAKNFGRKLLAKHESNDLGDRARAAELSAMLQDAYQYEGSLYAVFDTVQHFNLFNRTALYKAVSASYVPSMLIWGKDDLVTPIDNLDEARDLLQPEQSHVLECGHMVPFERSRDVANLIQAFIKIHSMRSTS
ncbi:alpha/beta fold hydrolase [Aquirhabdus parva]|uniref:Alpha/beta hydrolase n=1 Tax=Aquirhabdus parva TaxID=2283318 RepID=A0A345P562_9GAMM|nr:alpha/beta hydrolase [Aquirhabdus parva]AXI02421.1 alpha/beta hydrolase [Aquirhabdus parva]